MLFRKGDRVVFAGGNSCGLDIVAGDRGTVRDYSFSGSDCLAVDVDGKRRTNFLTHRWTLESELVDEVAEFFV